MVILYRKQKVAPPTQRRRMRALLLALVILWIFGTNDMMPIWNLKHYPFTNIEFYPLGSLAAIFYVVIISYSVMQHQLLDIHVTLSRLAAQLVRLFFMMLVGFCCCCWRGAWYRPDFPLSFGVAMGVLLVSGLVAGLFFPQFFGHGSDKLERRILGDLFEYHARVQALIQTMRSYPEPQHLLPGAAGTIGRHDEDAELPDYFTGRYHPRFQVLPLAPAANGARVARLAGGFSGLSLFPTNADQVPLLQIDGEEQDSLLQQQAREQLQSFEPEICFPFFVADDLIGMMLLGAKASGDVFTPERPATASRFVVKPWVVAQSNPPPAAIAGRA